jgi:hypothetical protein
LEHANKLTEKKRCDNVFSNVSESAFGGPIRLSAAQPAILQRKPEGQPSGFFSYIYKFFKILTIFKGGLG